MTSAPPEEPAQEPSESVCTEELRRQFGKGLLAYVVLDQLHIHPVLWTAEIREGRKWASELLCFTAADRAAELKDLNILRSDRGFIAFATLRPDDLLERA